MSHPVEISELQRLELFADLTPDLIKQLAAASRLTDYKANAVVFQEGDALPPYLYVLVSGQLRVAEVAASGKQAFYSCHPLGRHWLF